MSMNLYHFIYNDEKTGIDFAISVWERYEQFAAREVQNYISTEERYKGLSIKLQTIKANISKQIIFEGIHADATTFPEKYKSRIGCCAYKAE